MPPIGLLVGLAVMFVVKKFQVRKINSKRCLRLGCYAALILEEGFDVWPSLIHELFLGHLGCGGSCDSHGSLFSKNKELNYLHASLTVNIILLQTHGKNIIIIICIH